MPEVTSWRQYSPGFAVAGVVIAINASANKVAAGAAVTFKSCLILYSPCWLESEINTWEPEMSAPSAPKNSKGILSGARQRSEVHRTAVILNDDHHSKGRRPCVAGTTKGEHERVNSPLRLSVLRWSRHGVLVAGQRK